MVDIYKKINLDIQKQQAELINKMRPQIDLTQEIKSHLETSNRINEVIQNTYSPFMVNAEIQSKISALIKHYDFKKSFLSAHLEKNLHHQWIFSEQLDNSLKLQKIYVPYQEAINKLNGTISLQSEFINNYIQSILNSLDDSLEMLSKHISNMSLPMEVALHKVNNLDVVFTNRINEMTSIPKSNIVASLREIERKYATTKNEQQNRRTILKRAFPITYLFTGEQAVSQLNQLFVNNFDFFSDQITLFIVFACLTVLLKGYEDDYIKK